MNGRMTAKTPNGSNETDSFTRVRDLLLCALACSAYPSSAQFGYIGCDCSWEALHKEHDLE